ncbi:hypothetical protein G9A89_013391 [Geosiphon pyriformis]|nr:hypothetical protein G9A89_013391 [Geosiphon pyriformis]
MDLVKEIQNKIPSIESEKTESGDTDLALLREEKFFGEIQGSPYDKKVIYGGVMRPQNPLHILELLSPDRSLGEFSEEKPVSTEVPTLSKSKDEDFLWSPFVKPSTPNTTKPLKEIYGSDNFTTPQRTTPKTIFSCSINSNCLLLNKELSQTPRPQSLFEQRSKSIPLAESNGSPASPSYSSPSSKYFHSSYEVTPNSDDPYSYSPVSPTPSSPTPVSLPPIDLAMSSETKVSKERGTPFFIKKFDNDGETPLSTQLKSSKKQVTKNSPSGLQSDSDPETQHKSKILIGSKRDSTIENDFFDHNPIQKKTLSVTRRPFFRRYHSFPLIQSPNLENDELTQLDS